MDPIRWRILFGGAPRRTVFMSVPDLPTSKVGKGFTITGFDIRASTGHYYCADGVGRLDQNDVGPLASSLVELTRGGFTFALVNYWLLSGLMTGLEESAGVPVDPTLYSIQGVSCRDADDTIHITCVNTNVSNLSWRLVLDPANNMARLDADRISSAAVQHFEPDPVAGNYFALSPNSVRRRDIATLSNSGLGSSLALGITTGDECDAKTPGRLHITYGGNGPAGTIVTLATATDMASATTLGTHVMPEIVAIEGVRSRPNELLVAHDPAYHLVGGAGAQNGITSFQPNPLRKLYP